MILLILPISCLLLVSAAPTPGYFGHSYIGDHAPFYSSSYVSAPIIKTISAAPIYKTYSEPIYISAPIYKTFAPASSYATVASYKIAHAPIVKVVSSPIIKSYSSW